MLIVSAPMLSGPGFDNVQLLGVVGSQAFASPDILGSLGSPLQGGTCYSSLDGTDPLAQIRNNLINDIIRQTRVLGGNAIVAFRLNHECASFGDHAKILVSVDGTAALMTSR